MECEFCGERIMKCDLFCSACGKVNPRNADLLPQGALVKSECQLCESKVPRFPSEIYSAHLVSFSEYESNGLPKFGTSASIMIPCSADDRKRIIEMDERLKAMDAKKDAE